MSISPTAAKSGSKGSGLPSKGEAIGSNRQIGASIPKDSPTTGSVEMSGKVAALLELGIGFHPDFTGRQNAYMAGQLLGYSVHQITAMMPAIEEFAEIGEYIDQLLFG